jgi:predicted  nucleic acid-binding Zn-ribbon protein
MEGLEQANHTLSEITARRSAIEAELRNVIESLNREKSRLVSGIELAQADRKQLVGRLPADLVELFETKRKRAVPIGRLIHSECGACRMSISATNLAGIIKAPIDQLVFCPDCSAILVR